MWWIPSVHKRYQDPYVHGVYIMVRTQAVWRSSGWEVLEAWEQGRASGLQKETQEQGLGLGFKIVLRGSQSGDLDLGDGSEQILSLRHKAELRYKIFIRLKV